MALHDQHFKCKMIKLVQASGHTLEVANIRIKRQTYKHRTSTNFRPVKTLEQYKH